MPDQPQYLNPNFFKKNLAAVNVDQLFAAILQGDIASLSQGITLLESELEEHREKAQELLKLCLPHAGHSIRIGITGIPGAGKSTFVEAVGKKIIAEKNNAGQPVNKLAILAIDPSSSLSKGSILGDKTRMEDLTKLSNVFIRPTPTSGNLGGVARATKETMVLCEAAGFNIVMVETVGVGQSEIELHFLTDIFLLLLIPGAGDELQGIKRGIMEMADLILVNKADGEQATAALHAVKQLENALHYMQPNKYGRFCTVSSISALQDVQVAETWNLIKTNLNAWQQNESFFEKRKEQGMYWYEQSLNNGLKNLIRQKKDWFEIYTRLKTEITEGKTHPFMAADELLKKIISAK
jgi:LAO/AO transport system kinase